MKLGVTEIAPVISVIFFLRGWVFAKANLSVHEVEQHYNMEHIEVH